MKRLPSFIHPEVILILAVLQVCIAYILAMDTAGEIYRVGIQYGGLILWCLALFSFLSGAHVIKLFMSKGDAADNSLFVETIRGFSKFRIRISIYIALSLVLLSTTLIILFYGGAPLIMVALYGMSQSDFNEMQSDAAPGLFGFHALFVGLAEVTIAFSLMRSLVMKERIRYDFWVAILITILATLIDGKRQGMVMFLFMLSSCYVITKYILGDRHVFGSHKSRLIFGLTLAIFTLIFYVVTDNRLGASGEQEYGYSAAYEPLRYLCLPLVNIEFLYNFFYFEGKEFAFLKPLEYLIPAKLMADRGNIALFLPEPSSPLGIYAAVWLYWGGVVGIFVYMSTIGALCSFIFRFCSSNPKAIVIYGFVAWHLFASHTYNHFLTLNYFPLQCLVVFLVHYFIKNHGEVVR